MAAAEAQPEPESVSTCKDGDSSGSCPAAGAPRPAATPPGDVNACPPGKSDPTCTPSVSKPEVASPDDCADSSGADSCRKTDLDAQEHCPSGESGCKNEPQDAALAKSNENSGINGSERQGLTGQSHPVTDQGSHTDAGQEDRANPSVAVVTPAEPETRDTQSRNGSQDAASSPARGTGGAPAADGQTGSNVVSTTEEGESKQGSETEQPSSSNTSATGSDVGSNAATTENGTSSAESESPSIQESAGNTDTDTTTTTTTTTLPPELTNNKKGDADSSSSISSSVWVRVPLLIVVTLSCIL
ncbi:uncharacterized protein TM35_000621210, partial [Trypanosoma theileri]